MPKTYRIETISDLEFLTPDNVEAFLEDFCQATRAAVAAKWLMDSIAEETGSEHRTAFKYLDWTDDGKRESSVIVSPREADASEK